MYCARAVATTYTFPSFVWLIVEIVTVGASTGPPPVTVITAAPLTFGSAVEAAMTFTLPMLIARLAISAVASAAGGYGAALLAGRRRAATIAGIVLLLIFLPIHYGLFTKFPLWYHLAFLASLPLLSIAGGALASRREETA